VIPSVDVAAVVDPDATATKEPFPKATELQLRTAGIVLFCQVTPSGDVAEMPDVDIAT
jgi:hypothetical protein